MKKSLLFLAIVILVSFAMPTYAQQVSGPATVLRSANLRGGPGISFAVVGGVAQGNTVTVAGCNAACDWYELVDGTWIAAFLVELIAAPALVTEPITVVTWNTELNDADITLIGDRIAASQNVDLWGLVEVNRASYQSTLEQAAEVGEDADYGSVLGQSGGGDKLLALYNANRFTLIDSWEEDAINTTGSARAALVLQLRENANEQQFLFMVNHLYRSRDDERHKQAALLNDWAARQTLPVIAVGDYNFDWDLLDDQHDTGYDLMTAGGRFTWVRPETLVTTQCSGWPCEFNSVLDFVFSAGAAQSWRAEAEILVGPGDFPDDNTTSDHRPVLARFWSEDEQASVVPTQSARQPATATVANPTATTAILATRVPTAPAANRNANLRSGPGTSFSVAGSVQQGQTLRITGRNVAGDWYQLDNVVWIAAFLVDGAPTTLDEVAAPTVPTPIPSTATPVPAQPVIPAQPAAPNGVANVIIQTVYYDGQVSRVESDEYAVIANAGSASINIGGWRLNAGDPGQDFRFPGVELGPGQSVRVYTNQVHPESGGFSFGSGRAIWNNKGDCGVLFDASGQVVSEYCY